jgi:hypothetical protein
MDNWTIGSTGGRATRVSQSAPATQDFVANDRVVLYSIRDWKEFAVAQSYGYTRTYRVHRLS